MNNRFIPVYLLILNLFLPIDNYTQWIKQNSGVSLKLSEVAILDSTRVIAVGDSGTVLKSSNNGESWVKIDLGVTNNLKAVSFLDKDNILIVGDSLVAVTSDGGSTWEKEIRNYGFTSCLYYGPPDRSIVAGDSEGRLHIWYGGNQWKDTLLVNSEPILAIGVDGHSPILHGYNLTASSQFHTISTHLPNDQWDIYKNPVEFYDVISDGDLWHFPKYLVGSTGHLIPKPVYWKKEINDSIWTQDTVWIRYDNIFPDLYVPLLDIDAINSFVGVCGGNGTILRSFDEGTSWNKDSTGTNVNLNSIRFYNHNKGFCVGDRGTVLFLTDNIISVREVSSQNNDYKLYQNYPNPFNPSTEIKYFIPQTGFVTINIYDLLGKVVSVVVNDIQSAGEHSISFNSHNLSVGIYFYELHSNNGIIRKKMLLIK